MKAKLRKRTQLTLSAWTNLYDKKYSKKQKVKSKPVEARPLTLREKVNKISKIYGNPNTILFLFYKLILIYFRAEKEISKE